MKDEFPYANVLPEETTNYNCCSYAYYSQNTRTNKYWINDPRNYFGIDFVQRASGTQIQVNDRIFCWKGSSISSAGLDSLHSGISTNHGTMIKSKWGPYALYEHAYNDCPYYTGANIIWYRPV